MSYIVSNLTRGGIYRDLSSIIMTPPENSANIENTIAITLPRASADGLGGSREAGSVFRGQGGSGVGKEIDSCCTCTTYSSLKKE